MSESIRIDLEHDEALVLFEYLALCRSGDHVPVSSDKIVLDNLECLLERQIVEVFSQNYAQEVEAARARLLAQYGDR
jgi:hypothetical protein